MCHVNSHYLLKHQHSALIDKKTFSYYVKVAISVPGKNHFKYFLLPKWPPASLLFQFPGTALYFRRDIMLYTYSIIVKHITSDKARYLLEVFFT